MSVARLSAPWWVGIVAVVAAACAGGAEPVGDAGGRPPSDGPATVDLSRHSVPLEDIHLDTFDGGSVPLSEADPALIERLHDAIPPLDDPPYVRGRTVDWLADDDLVIGVVDSEGGAWAWPHRILNFHEIVNDTIAGVPVLVSYCPLCASGIVYDRRVDGRTLRFSNTSALYQTDLVMVDRSTRSWWWQVAGRAIVGELTGAELAVLPSATMRWADWLALHPATLVLSRDLGTGRSYDRDPFVGYAERVNAGRTPFPVDRAALEDGRLPPATRVVGVVLDGEARVWPVEQLDLPVHDTVSGRPVVVLPSGVYTGPHGQPPPPLTAISPGRYRDPATGVVYDAAGRPDAADVEALVPVPSRTTFWFAFVAAHPDATVGP